jgi:hypothetical protein
MRKTKPYAKWPKSKDGRRIEMTNHFGRDLMIAARNYAFEKIPAEASPEAKRLARKALLDAIYGVTMLLDGVSNNLIDEQRSVEYALMARVVTRDDKAETLEEIELAPDGEGLCMGYHDWVEEPEPGKAKDSGTGGTVLWSPRFYMNDESELMQFRGRTLGGAWYYVLLARDGCGLVPGKMVIPSKLPAGAVRADIFVENEDGESIAYFHKARLLGVFPMSRDDKWLVDLKEMPADKVLKKAESLDPGLVERFLKDYERFRSKKR